MSRTSRYKLTEEEITYVNEQITEVMGNFAVGKDLEKAFDLYKNLVIHCEENIFDIQAKALKAELETYFINRIKYLTQK